jgi:hypothetical protein
MLQAKWPTAHNSLKCVLPSHLLTERKQKKKISTPAEKVNFLIKQLHKPERLTDFRMEKRLKHVRRLQDKSSPAHYKTPDFRVGIRAYSYKRAAFVRQF